MQGPTEEGPLSQIARESRPEIVGGLVVLAVGAALAWLFRSNAVPKLLVVLADLVAVAATLWVLRAHVPSRIIGGTPRPRFGSRVRQSAVIGLVVPAIVTFAVFAPSGASEIPALGVAFVNKTDHRVLVNTTGQAIITAPVSPGTDQQVANAQVRLVDSRGVIKADEIALKQGAHVRLAVRFTRPERLRKMFEDGTLSLRLIFARAETVGPLVTAGEIPFSSKTFATRYIELDVNDTSG